MLRKLLFTLILVLTFGTVTTHAQIPASYVGGSVDLNFAGNYGFKVPSVGGGISAGFKLPARFYVTETAEFLKEEKKGVPDGRSLSSTTGLQYHFNDSFFARGGVQIAAHDNSVFGSKVVSRTQVGAGFQVLNVESQMPRLHIDAAYVFPISDENELRGVKVTARSFYEFKNSPFGVFGEANGSYSTFIPTFGGKNRVGGTAVGLKFGVFLNLSALGGD